MFNEVQATHLVSRLYACLQRIMEEWRFQPYMWAAFWEKREP